MVEINSTPRLFSIDSPVILTQTDTTVGFLSQDADKLYEIKSRNTSKPFIQVYKDFKSLKEENVRVPSSFKKMLRRATKTTFIVQNYSFRVASDRLSSSLLRSFRFINSTSANESGKKFERDFCQLKADIIIEDNNKLYEGVASSLYKINSKKIKRLR